MAAAGQADPHDASAAEAAVSPLDGLHLPAGAWALWPDQRCVASLPRPLGPASREINGSSAVHSTGFRGSLLGCAAGTEMTATVVLKDRSVGRAPMNKQE